MRRPELDPGNEQEDLIWGTTNILTQMRFLSVRIRGASR